MNCKDFLLINIIAIAATIQPIKAQEPDKIYKPFIATAQLFQSNNQTQLPVLNTAGGSTIDLSFDDLEGNYKYYSYTYQLCDYDWKPVDLSPFSYIKGFTENRINTYRYSSLALTKYTHYEITLPEQNSYPKISGNYLLKVYLNGDTAELAFTKRLLVVETKAAINASIVQLLGAQNFTTYQKVRFTVTTEDINAFSAAQQVKVVILQNNRWDNAQKDILPTFVRGNVLDYSNENVAQFPAGKEWRWLDLRSFTLQSERIDHANYGKKSTDMYVKTDIDRSGQRYIYYPDFNGTYAITTFESINPYWQSDYANVHFSFATTDGKPFYKKEMYLSGQFTGYEISEKYRMKFNDSTNLYELSVPMKQGYYSYTYSLLDNNEMDKTNPLEGNYWETENNYTILVYYKGFSDRTDQLISVGQVNSRRDRPGLSF